MFFGILVGIALISFIMTLLGGVFKKALEILSAITKFGVGVLISLLIQQAVLPEAGTWGQLAFVVVGGIIVYSIIEALSASFRLVGYSINYLISSVVLALIVTMLNGHISLTLAQYLLALFLFPRIIWISDRFATTSVYSHSEYGIWDNVVTDVFTIKDVDHYGSSEYSWNHLPLQITIAFVFFAMGTCTVFSEYPVESFWMQLLYIIPAAVINIVFDLFVFRRIDK